MVLGEEGGVKAGGSHTDSNGPVPVDLSDLSGGVENQTWEFAGTLQGSFHFR